MDSKKAFLKIKGISTEELLYKLSKVFDWYRILSSRDDILSLEFAVNNKSFSLYKSSNYIIILPLSKSDIDALERVVELVVHAIKDNISSYGIY